MKLLTKKVSDYFLDLDLDYSDRNSATSFFSSDNNIHPYPARAVPEMVNLLLTKLQEYFGVKSVLDPFVGSGTVALEAKITGLDFYGTDLNPLAILLAKTKALNIRNTKYVKKELVNFIESLKESKNTPFVIESFPSIDYWFKSKNITELSYLKYRINGFLHGRSNLYREIFALILLTAFSSTVRASSLTRNSEFKLYRMSPYDMKKFNADSCDIFSIHVKNLLDMLNTANDITKEETKTRIYLANAKNINSIVKNKVDLILTSPPYGDSKSTVSYGQFSRLSLQWMGDLLTKYLRIEVSAKDCDNSLLGGIKSTKEINQEMVNQCIEASETLKDLITEMEMVVAVEKDKIKKMEDNYEEFKEQLCTQPLFCINKFNFDCNLKQLLEEHVRLHIYRKINKSNSIPRDKLKKLVTYESANSLKSMENGTPAKRWKKSQLLRSLLPILKEAIRRKKISVPKRVEEVKLFFADLFHVHVELDKVLVNGGVQAWIVGHRTVLGKIQVNLASVLLDWFRNSNYVEIQSMKRQCHFKRLPHHINSTATRQEKVKTMMEEYIIVVQKT